MVENDNFIPTNWAKRSNIITVVGVGGGGGNAVAYMQAQGIENVDFAICNTDLQALESKDNAISKIQLGKLLTKGLGAGMDSITGRKAAEESSEEIARLFEGKIEMAFITCGMGGGTGTGAAPVVASIAKKAGKLTVGVVTLPFRDEGEDALDRAIEGINELSHYVDSLLIIDNQKLYELYGDMNIFTGFCKANEVLCTAVKSIADVITKSGHINTDFADVKRVMQNSGVALMGIGSGAGKDRVETAVNQAISSPLLNKLDVEAKNAIVNITTSSKEPDGISFGELSTLMNLIHEKTGENVSIKRGIVYDDSMGDAISVTIIATGFEMAQLPTMTRNRKNVIEVTFDQDSVKYRKFGVPLCPEEDSHIIRKSHIEGKPSLLTSDPEEITILSEEPAFKRRPLLLGEQNKEKDSSAKPETEI